MNKEEKTIISEIATQPAEEILTENGKSLKVGLVGNYADTDETRFLLTPEGCGLLTSSGITVMMETGAATDISFPDSSYEEFGAKIVSREEALKGDVVLSYLPLKADDVRQMKDGATLFSMMDEALFDKNVVGELLRKNITMGALDNMVSFKEVPVFADIVDEIDGRTSIVYAQEFLSYVGGGKGVLLAGVAGLNPCEVLVIGDGIKAYSAAKAAQAAGAYVTLMNNDIGSLIAARQYCGDNVNITAIHPRVLFNKVKSADVILIGECTRNFEFPKNLRVAVKENAYIMNFSETQPSLSVPRTVAMALSNVMVNFFEELLIKGGVGGLVANTPGVQEGIICYRGKLVDKLVASYLGMPSVDIKVMIAASN